MDFRSVVLSAMVSRLSQQYTHDFCESVWLFPVYKHILEPYMTKIKEFPIFHHPPKRKTREHWKLPIIFMMQQLALFYQRPLAVILFSADNCS